MEPPTWEASRCYELHGLDGARDLEGLRKTWMLDEPKCQRGSSKPPLKITLQLDPVAVGGGHHHARVSLLGAGPPRGLGRMSNMSGAVGFRHSPDVNGIMVSASDMGLDLRFAYQLGDRILLRRRGRPHPRRRPSVRCTYEVRGSCLRPASGPRVPLTDTCGAVCAGKATREGGAAPSLVTWGWRRGESKTEGEGCGAARTGPKRRDAGQTTATSRDESHRAAAKLVRRTQALARCVLELVRSGDIRAA